MSAAREFVELNVLRSIRSEEEIQWTLLSFHERYPLLLGVWVETTTFPSSPVDDGRDTLDTRRNMLFVRRERISFG